MLFYVAKEVEEEMEFTLERKHSDSRALGNVEIFLSSLFPTFDVCLFAVWKESIQLCIENAMPCYLLHCVAISVTCREFFLIIYLRFIVI